jgi:hypothetical protein
MRGWFLFGIYYLSGISQNGRRHTIRYDVRGNITGLKIDGVRQKQLPKMPAGVYMVQKSLGHRRQAR